MPLYRVTTHAGALASEARARLAAELTNLHSQYSDIPNNRVQITFQEHVSSSAIGALTLLIQTGRFAGIQVRITYPHSERVPERNARAR